MKTAYRVLNGMKARGVPKNYSAEERQKRSDRMREVQRLSIVAIDRKARERRERKAEIKRLVEAAAAVGVFVPIQEGE